MRGILLLNSKWFLRRTCYNTWWRHQVETFSALLSVCVENSPVPGEFPAQRTVTRNFDVFFDLRPTKLLGKQSWGWWFDTPSRPSRRHRNELLKQKCCDEISDTTQEVRHNSAIVDNLIIMTFSIQRHDEARVCCTSSILCIHICACICGVLACFHFSCEQQNWNYQIWRTKW